MGPWKKLSREIAGSGAVKVANEPSPFKYKMRQRVVLHAEVYTRGKPVLVQIAARHDYGDGAITYDVFSGKSLGMGAYSGEKFSDVEEDELSPYQKPVKQPKPIQ